MEAVIWLGIYLTVGSLLLWACHGSPACLLHSRMERNGGIASALGTAQRPPSPRAASAAPTRLAVRR